MLNYHLSILLRRRLMKFLSSVGLGLGLVVKVCICMCVCVCVCVCDRDREIKGGREEEGVFVIPNEFQITSLLHDNRSSTI